MPLFRRKFQVYFKVREREKVGRTSEIGGACGYSFHETEEDRYQKRHQLSTYSIAKREIMITQKLNASTRNSLVFQVRWNCNMKFRIY